MIHTYYSKLEDANPFQISFCKPLWFRNKFYILKPDDAENARLAKGKNNKYASPVSILHTYIFYWHYINRF
jgi:hypothetical protein